MDIHRFRIRKVSGGPSSILSTDGQNVDVDVGELRYGEHKDSEMLIKIELEKSRSQSRSHDVSTIECDGSICSVHGSWFVEYRPSFSNDIPQHTPQHPSHMPFSVYLYRSTLSSPRAAEARKAAINAVVRSLDEHGKRIKRKFGFRNWVVVL